MKVGIGVGVLLLLGNELAGAQAKMEPLCSAVALTVSLTADEEFQRRINDNLTFKMLPLQEQSGWDFRLEDTAGHDFIYPVNPPLRFNASQTLGRGYGESAKQSLNLDRELRFLLRRSDYDRFMPFVNNALWPYNAPNPERTADEYLAALTKQRTGVLRLKILHAEVGPDDKVRSAKFQVELIAAAEFHFDPSLKPHKAACPAQRVP